MTSKNNTKKTYKAEVALLVQEYEAYFGIQGSRIWKLTRDELAEAIRTNIANSKAPSRR